MEEFVGIIAILCTIGLPITAWIIWRLFVHRERMELIRHGLTPQTPGTTWRQSRALIGPPEGAGYGDRPRPPKNRGSCDDDDSPGATLRKGIRLTAIGAALTVGLSFIGFDETFHPQPWLLFGLIPMFVGLSHVLIAVLSGATFAGRAPGTAPGAPYDGPLPAADMPPPPGATYEGPYTYRPSGEHPELRPPFAPPERR